MRTISLWQPWASLIGGGKSIETRSWCAPYRGLIAIHAAKHFTAAERDLCGTEPFNSALMMDFPEREDDLPLGAAVYTQTCIPERPWYRNDLGKVMIGENERSFGNYDQGRYAWLLSDIQILREPIPYRGAQGLFSVPDELFPVEVLKGRAA